MVDRTSIKRPFPTRLLALAGAIVFASAACGGSPSSPSASAVLPAASPANVAAPQAGAPLSGLLPPPSLGSRTATARGLPSGLLIADEGNGRLVAISSTGAILWQFPSVAGAVPAGQSFTADDAFFAPDGKTIVANDEFHQVIDRIDIATGRVIWQYGHYGHPSGRAGYLHNPDDAYPLANGDVIVADIVNCRVIEIAPSKQIVSQWGKTGHCVVHAPTTYGDPNGDTPLPDGGLLITEIHGSRVVRLDANGKVIFNIHVPARYPSDAQLDANGNIVLADYSNPGAVLCVSPTGKLLWRYAPISGTGRLDHPSLATPLPDGTVVVNDDFRHRIVVINPATMTIVWQYGHTDHPGRASGYLSQPDGHQPIPAGVVF